MAGGELRLTIIHCLRLNAVRGIFHRHNFGLLNHPSDILMPCCLSSLPFVVITYRLALVDDRLDEVWNCDMAPTAHGFSVVSIGTFFLNTIIMKIDTKGFFVFSSFVVVFVTLKLFCVS